MSRQTKDCYAEVEFLAQGKSYIAHWEQGFTRNDTLRTATHYLYDANGTVITDQIKKTAAKIIELTGMNYDQFTRSILLAQGAFDNFLKADDEEKSAVLEQITGSKIYTEISVEIHKRNSHEKQKLADLNMEVSGIAILNDEEEQKLNHDLQANKIELQTLTKTMDSTNKAINWLENIARVKKELQDITAQQVELTKKLNTFAPNRANLKRAQEAATLDIIYTELKSLRKQLEDNKQKLEANEKTLPKLTQDNEQCEQALKEAKALQAKCDAALNDAKETFKLVRDKDQQIASLKIEINGVSTNVNSCEQKIKTLAVSQKNNQNDLDFYSKQQAEIKKYFADNNSDEWLVEGVSGVEVKLNQLAEKQNEISTQKSNIDSVGRNLDKAKQQHKTLEDNEKIAQADIAKAQERFNASKKLSCIGVKNLE